MAPFESFIHSGKVVTLSQLNYRGLLGPDSPRLTSFFMLDLNNGLYLPTHFGMVQKNCLLPGSCARRDASIRLNSMESVLPIYRRVQIR